MGNWFDSFVHHPLGWAGPLAEVAVIALVVYGLFGFIRITRGAGVMRGASVLLLIVFIVFMFVADYLRLENVSWLLENGLTVGLMALVVIFQPEIRQALVRLGETIRLAAGPGDDVVKEIVDAVLSISQRSSVGALIVVERDNPVDIKTGIPLDAQVTSQLLRTIFTKNTPLHDGAAIVRQGRLVAANCLLPLSENVEVCRGMGTRHRAAIGISEQTDAVTVVVSEENNQISITVNGKIHRALDQEKLRALLRTHLTTRPDAVYVHAGLPARGGQS